MDAPVWSCEHFLIIVEEDICTAFQFILRRRVQCDFHWCLQRPSQQGRDSQMIQQTFEHAGLNDCLGCITDIASGTRAKAKHSSPPVKRAPPAAPLQVAELRTSGSVRSVCVVATNAFFSNLRWACDIHVTKEVILPGCTPPFFVLMSSDWA